MAKSSPHQPVYGSLPAEGFVRLSKLLDVLPFSDATLWRRVGKGTFPRPKKLSEKITAWRVEEVRAWLDSQPDAEDESHNPPASAKRTARSSRDLAA